MHPLLTNYSINFFSLKSTGAHGLWNEDVKCWLSASDTDSTFSPRCSQWTVNSDGIRRAAHRSPQASLSLPLPRVLQVISSEAAGQTERRVHWRLKGLAVPSSSPTNDHWFLGGNNPFLIRWCWGKSSHWPRKQRLNLSLEFFLVFFFFGYLMEPNCLEFELTINVFILPAFKGNLKKCHFFPPVAAKCSIWDLT